MKVLITGGAGFIGIMLARKLLSLPDLTGPDGKRHKIEELVLFDMVVPDKRPAGLDQRARFVSGEISDQPSVAKLIDRPDMGIFHLASVVSGGGELDFDLAMRVNLHGHLHL
ncbi:MAG TPA: NAD-dependent epimerase/dehydratase family protein, partial [Dongiaceae bacterium]|nr:NAD-dependent epimerase/dehydratase family protein [Dongiaceae bacterium]